MAWTPVVDVSEHQGAIDFGVMKRRGVRGVILRAIHGLKQDDRLGPNAVSAHIAFGRHVGYYEFCNPKRSGPREAARAFVAAVAQYCPLDRTFLMLDIEGYVDQTPDKGIWWAPDRYARWLWDHLDELIKLTGPYGTPIIGYTNRAYWSSGVGDRTLAATLDWIVPRYPEYSLVEYDRNRLPTDPAEWDEWAYRTQPTGPQEPIGADGWEGWQFSAGYNRQGSFYGCQSADLDLNIIKTEAWERWTRTAAQAVTTKGDQPMFRGLTMAGGQLVLLVTPGEVRRVSGEEAAGVPIYPISRQGVLDIFAEGAHSVGESPFQGRFGEGYRDQELSDAWSRATPQPGGVADFSVILAELATIRGQLSGLDFLKPGA